MTATSRWVRFPVAGTTAVSSALVGQSGFSRGTDSVSDSFTIPGSANNQIRVNVDGGGAQQITLSSGTSLEPRFVAKDIQRKVQAFSSVNDGFKWFTCEWSNMLSSDGKSHFVLKSGSTGASSSVAVTAGDSDARSILGLSTVSEVAGDTYHTDLSRVLTTANSASYTGVVTVTGTYGGLLDEEYQVVVCDSALLSVSPGGSNTYAGTVSVTGNFNHDTACSYTVTIDCTGGNEVMNAGTGNVPTFTVNDTGTLNDDVSTPQEMLYSDTYYYIGTKGVMLSWSDAQFATGDTFTVTATPASAGGGAVGVATFRGTSSRGDNSSSNSTVSSTPVSVGTKGISMAWSDSGTLTAKDAWAVKCKAPTPEAYGVTSVSYGNVTVTTSSAVKVHQFEIMSGARVLSDCKFSLQDDGTFSHHDAGNGDTEFHFGTVGVGHRGDGSGVAGTGVEWVANVSASDITQDKTGGSTGAPTNLWASVKDLAVVSDASSAEIIGSHGLCSDAIFTSITLGASETGANSSIVYRLYFSYS